MRKSKNEHLLPVEIWRIYPYPDVTPPETFLVVLKGEEGRFVPISIGFPEGQYLVMAMQSVSFPRPLTHTLMKNLIEKVKGRVHQLVIHTLKDETFHAYLLIQTQEEVFYLDCRPSDGMILATLMSVPIFMSPEVMEEAGRDLSGMLDIAELNDELSALAQDEEEEADEAAAMLPSTQMAPPGGRPRSMQMQPCAEESVDELDALRARLDRLVAEEAYEEAARVRDQITQLEESERD